MNYNNNNKNKKYYIIMKIFQKFKKNNLCKKS